MALDTENVPNGQEGRSWQCCRRGALQGFLALGSLSIMILYNIASWGEKSLVATEDSAALRGRIETLEQIQSRYEERLAALESSVQGGRQVDESLPIPSVQASLPTSGLAARRLPAPPRQQATADVQKSSCPLLGLAALKSRKTMEKAGWEVDFTDLQFSQNGLTGWRSHVEVGHLKLTMPVAGTARFFLRNELELKLPDNLVRAFINDDLLIELGPSEQHWVCVSFEAGDTLIIREEFAKINLQNMKMACATSTTSAAPSAGTQTKCKNGQTVKVLMHGGVCRSRSDSAEPTWANGEITKTFSSSLAAVRIQSLGDSGESQPRQWQQILPASRLYHQDDVQGARCGSYHHEKYAHGVGLVVLADKHFRSVYSVQIDTLRCSAKRHGYQVHLLEATTYRGCAKFRRNFFFLKHCVVSEFLGTQVPNYMAVVLDADVVAAVLDRGLDKWTSHDADLQFYERVWNDEIAAGNYIARNTPFARKFLMQWADFQTQQPKGYASADNGAIHLHIIETLALEGAAHCRTMYKALVADVNNLDPYFSFVKCAKQVLGPPRDWEVDGGGKLTVWPRLHFFVADGFFINHFASSFLGPVFHHGIKEAAKVKEMYYNDVGRCKLKTTRLKQPEEFGVTVVGIVRGWKDLYAQNKDCVQCINKCMPTFDCRPLKMDEEPKALPAPLDCPSGNCRQIFSTAHWKYLIVAPTATPTPVPTDEFTQGLESMSEGSSETEVVDAPAPKRASVESMARRRAPGPRPAG